MMSIPMALATVAACGSIVTSIKSSWELRRMIKRKQESKECDEEAPYIFRRLRRAYYDGHMSPAEYEQWYEKFLIAKVDKDLASMRKIRARLRILENGAPGAPTQRPRGIERRRGSHSESDSAGSLCLGFSQSRESLEYHPLAWEITGAHPSQFVRLERKVTYSRSPSSEASSRGRRRSNSARQESRGRSERRHDSHGSGSDSSDGSSEKRHCRGRTLRR